MPQVVVAAAINYIGGQLAWTAATMFVAQVAAGWAVGRVMTLKAERSAKRAYNASLRDRMQMVDITPAGSARMVLGRVRTVEGIRRRWVSGEHDKQLTLLVSFAGHEIDAFETFYLNDLAVTLDGSGWVQTSPYLKAVYVSKSASVLLDATGTGTHVASSAVNPDGLSAFTGLGGADQFITATASGNTITVSGGPPDATVTVTWQESAGQSLVRIRTWLGTDGQNVGADLAAEYPGKISSSDRFAGVALVAMDLIFDPDVFPQGIPNLTAVLRGAKVLDPRTGTTAWSDNPALLAYHYARHPLGWAVPAGEIRTADISAAATVCEASTVFPLRKLTGELANATLPRYRCGLTIDTAGDPRAAMDDIFETMAGRWGWAGGTWRMRAGVSAAPVFAMDASWIAAPLDQDGLMPSAPLVNLTNGVPREQKVNQISGICVDQDQRWQILPFPAVSDSALVAAEGAFPLEVEFQGISHIAHAQQLARIIVRSGQASLRMEASCNLNAWRCELFDVGTVTLPRYGFNAKLFEVLGWRWHPTEGIKLTTAETSAAIYAVEELTGRDPAPNSSLPPPWYVAPIEGVAVESGTTDLLDDGSVLTRTQVSWLPTASDAIRQGGQIEVQYLDTSLGMPAADADWPSWIEQGKSTSAVIAGLRAGIVYLFRVRAISAGFAVRGRWSTQVAHFIALPPAGGGGSAFSLQATAQAFTFDAIGAARPASQTITLLAVLGGLTGTVTFAATLYDAAGTSLGPAGIAGSGNSRTITHTAFGAAAYCVVTATLGTASDQLTIVRLTDGANAVTGYLTNESHTVATTSDGSGGSYGTAGGTFRVYNGTTEVTGAAVAYSVVASSGITGLTINSAGVYALSGTGADTGTATLRAVFGGVTIDRVYSISRARGGVAGTGSISAKVFIYKRSASGTPSLPSVAATYTFYSGTLAGLNNGWTGDVPIGTDPLYVSAATAVATDVGGSTYAVIYPGAWAGAALMSQSGTNGSPGTDGLNSATVFLYQRNGTGTAPSAPGTTLTYTFSSGLLSGALGSWSQTVPAASGGKYLFVTLATALSTGSSDSITAGEWSTVRLMAQDGTRGPVTVAWTVPSSGYIWSYGGSGSGGPADTAAAAAVASATGGDSPRTYDIVTLYVAGSQYSETRYLSPTAGMGWVPIGSYLSGSVLMPDAISESLSTWLAGPVTYSNIG